MKGFKKILILLMISALIIGVGAVSAADDLGASEDIINTEVSADLNAIDESPSIDDSNQEDIISVNEENDEIEEIQSGESASLNENTNAVKANGNTITVQGNTFQDIQDAIDSASEGDTISLSGTYYGSGDAITIDYDHQVSIIGNGKTVLDAKGLSRILTVYHSDVTVKNINFLNGNVSFEGDSAYGGAVCWRGDNGILRNCSFVNNSIYASGDMSAYGGAVSWDGDNGILENCSFVNNSVYANGEMSARGGAVSWYGYNGILRNCSFVNNSGYGSGDVSARGGAVCWDGDNGILENCSFVNNSVNGLYTYGGAVSWYGYNGILRNCSFVNNSAISHAVYGWELSAHGGAVCWTGYNGTLLNCTFADNSVISDFSEVDDDYTYDYAYGGAVYWSGDNGTLLNCTFADNSVHATYANGGVLYWSSDEGIIGQCNFTNNDADNGIIYINGRNNGINNCLFENNSAEDYETSKSIFYLSAESGNCSLTGSSFINNSGYAISWWGSRGNITDCVFINNSDIFKASVDDIGEQNYLDNVYMDNGVYDFSIKVYDEVVLGNPKYYYDDYDYEEKPNWLVYLEHYGNKQGNLVVYLNGEEAYNDDMNHRNRLSISDLHDVKYGLVDLTVKFVSDESEFVIYDGSVYIDYDFEISGFYDEQIIIYYDSQRFTIFLPEDATGKLSVYDGIETHDLQYANGESSYKLNAYNQKIGNHTLSVSLTNDPKYPDKTITRSFYVIPKIDVPYNVAVGEDDYIIIDSPDDFDGSITIYNGTEEEIQIEYEDWTDYDYIILKDKEIKKLTDAEGVVKIPISDLPLNVGSNILIFRISGQGYYEEINYMKIIENDPRFSSSIDSNNIGLGDNVIIRITAPKSTGGLMIEVDGQTYKELSLGKTSFVETISGLGVGEHQIKVKVYEGWSVSGETEYIYLNSLYVNVTEEGHSTPEPLNATIELDYLDENVVIKLKDLDGNPLSGKKVSVYANNVESNLTTDSNGEAIVPITESSTIRAVYTDANGFNVSSSLVVKVVEKIVIEHEEVPVSANATISLTPDGDSVKIVLKDLSGNALSKFVNVTVNGINYPNIPTNATGETTVSVSGNYSIVVVYTDDFGASVSASLINVLTPVTPTLAATSISASAITTVAKTNKNLVLTLKDVDGKPLTNKNVTVSINGKTTTVTTNSNGQATIKTNFASSGTYYYSLCYLGDDNHKASFKTVKVTVNKQATKAVFKAKTFKVKATKKISFTLKDASGKVIAKKKITFKVNGKTYTATTNSKGVATVTIKISKKGTYTASAKFAGDSAYKTVSKSAKITIK